VPLPLPLPLPGCVAVEPTHERKRGSRSVGNAAVLDILARRRLAAADKIQAAKDLLAGVVSMLVRMIQAPMRSGRGMGKGRGTEPPG